MREWVYMQHRDLDDGRPPIQVPADEPAVKSLEARGWSRVEETGAEPGVVPERTETDPGEPWVYMRHPDLPQAVQQVPNDPAAVQGQLDAGWVVAENPEGSQEADEDSGDGDAEGKSAAKKARKTTSSRSAADEDQNDEKKG